ncbi:sphingomyelin phosphodiesterase 3 [Lingula anatina]|uniref:sphingomyelin phosphodiesterase n=1 Tax=Lingula anatina TaxID=7574 RepID=A0A1S3HSL0_LINAN|nr:sphingomyelin phosphodiesterase 3 [Lingula anatina]|eukprot:XP_013389025.1 sphingomyelin phosphodiesterase 3 [Lingula anatina]
MSPPSQRTHNSRCLGVLYNISWGMTYPTYWLTNKLLTLFISTSRERSRRGWEEPCYEHYIIITFAAPVLLALIVITLPLCMLGLLIWVPTQKCRSSLRYSSHSSVHDFNEQDAIDVHNDADRIRVSQGKSTLSNLELAANCDNPLNSTDVSQSDLKSVKVHAPFPPQPSSSACRCMHDDVITKNQGTTQRRFERRFTVATANVCLMPEFIARINNLSNTQWRAKTIGSRIIENLSKNDTENSVLLNSDVGEQNPNKVDSEGYGILTGTSDNSLKHCHRDDETKSHELTDKTIAKKELTDVAVGHTICQTESTNDSSEIQELTDNSRSRLSHDLGTHKPDTKHSDPRCHSDPKCLVSTHFPAELDFLCLQEVFDRRASHTLVKKLHQHFPHIVHDVGVYFRRSAKDIRSQQLNDTLQWIEEFILKTRNPEERILFDLLCGDLNFDNMSTDDRVFYTHPLLQKYQDPCRVTPGVDQSWALGTEIYQKKLYVDTEELTEILTDPERIKKYVEDVIIKEEDSVSGSSLPKANGRRRIDYLLYCNDHMDTNMTLNVVEYRYISQLASLTDHIPLSMTLTIRTNLE